VGPFQSGKTTLLEAILARTGAIKNAGSVDAGTSVGDSSPEARHHKMGVGLSAATTTFMGDSYTFIDCPGSIEFAHDMRAALPAVDAAIVVCEADEKKLPQLQIILRELEEMGIPRFLFLNKIDKANKRIRETLATLQPASRVPLVLRQIPIWNGELIEGFVDLALERAFVYREHKPSGSDRAGRRQSRPREGSALLDARKARRSRRRADGAIAGRHPAAARCGVRRSRPRIARRPDLPGAARRRHRENGVLRLMKALRHEAPGVTDTAKRLWRVFGQGCAGLCVQDPASAARRQAVAGAAVGRTASMTARRCYPRPAKAGRVSGILAVMRRMTASARRRKPATPWRSASSDAIKTGDTLSSGKTAPASLARRRADTAGAGDVAGGE
jgi:elongation factor G